MQGDPTVIGASEVGAILGLDPYKSELDVFMSKKLPEDRHEKDHQRWGLDLEPAILSHHVRRRGYALLDPPGRLSHPKLPLRATPDALARAAEVTIDLQAKNDQGHGQIAWGEPGTDDAPLLYVAQVTVELGVLRANGRDVSHGEIVVSIRGAPPVSYRVDFDEELFGQVAEICAKWKRDHLDTGKPPEGTASETAEYVRRRWARHDDRMLEATSERVELVRWVRERRSSVKHAQEELTAAENALKAEIGEAQGVHGLCTWKLAKGSTYTVTKEPHRVLRLLGAKEE